MSTADSNDLHHWKEAVTVAVRGTNVNDFLQGYLTHDCHASGAGELAATALCNLKGRVVANGWAYHPADSDTAMHIVVHQTLAARLIEFLNPYARFARCELKLDENAVVLSETQGLPLGIEDWRLLPTPVNPQSTLTDASEQLNLAMIRAKFAWITEATSEKFLPQMLDLDRIGAIDFAKGCYLGQEVVARAQFRGAVKRKLTHSRYPVDDPPAVQKSPVVGAKHAQYGQVIAVGHDSDAEEFHVLGVV